VRTDQRTPAWGYPPSRPFLLLSVYFGISVLQLSIIAARPPFPNTNSRALWGLAAVSALLLLAVVIAWARRATTALPVIVGGGVLVGAASTYVSVGGQGQLIAGFYLAALGLFAGYFLSTRAVRVLATLAIVAYVSALIATWRLDSPGYLLAVVLLVLAVSLVVSSLVQHLRGQAGRDPLTGALNRRGLGEAAETAHDRDQRASQRTTIVEIDLDGFKAYNDAHGHAAGDTLLSGLVDAWRTELRHTDVLARTGGDEFVLVLPATSTEEAEALVVRMHAAHPAGWSHGTAAWLPGEQMPVALQRADLVMYEHKKSRS
jgi:diguanylate cyclase (GGDEF)-like protein